MRRIIHILLLMSVLYVPVVSNAQGVEPTLLRQVDKIKMEHWVDSVFSRLTTDEKIGQLFMIVGMPQLQGQNMQKLQRLVDEVKIGGILFRKGDPVTQAKVTNRLQKSSKVPMLVSLDGEWGLSMRLSGTTRFPKNMMLGAIEDNSLIEEYGKEVARQCKEMGIHINFAPDIDVNSNVDNPVIGIRSFGENAAAVAEKGIAYAKGLESQGIIAVSKHFPGHGDTSEDSHKTLPILRHDRHRLDSVEMLPFKRYIDAGFSGVMVAHLQVPALDKSRQATSMSKGVVTDLLQKEMGFQGLCITDGLEMKGALTNKKDNPSMKALLAGNDILLAPAAPITDFRAIKAAVENGTIDMKLIDEKCRKILRYKYVAGLNNYTPIETKALSERLNTPHAEWLASKLNSEAITLLKNVESILPLRQLDKKKIAVLSIGDELHNEFQQTLSQYDSIAHFSIERRSSSEHVKSVYEKLRGFDVIICSVHTIRIPEHPALEQLALKKELIYSFFTLPYTCKEYKKSISKAKAVILAYESTPLAKRYAAQAIFGGIALKGKLPVSIPELYYAGTGLFTEKCRLGYHQPEEVGLNPYRLSEIDSIVNEGLDKRAYPGCQVLVAKDGMIVYNRSFGKMDYTSGLPVTEKTLYDLASASKAAGTLVAAMKAYDNNLFTLNDKLSDHIPELKGSNKSDISIKEILYHQSGVTPTINFYLKAIDNDSYKGSLYSSVKRQSHPVKFDSKTYVRNDFKYLPDLVSYKRKPGFTTEVARDFYVSDSFKDSIMHGIKESKLGKRGRYSYSCVNFIMLKMMVENLTKRPMDRLLYEDFYSRLGATSTMYNPLHKFDTISIAPTENDGFVRRQILQGYVHDEAAAFQGGVSGNAGLFSNANDLAKVLQMMLDNGEYGGERYLSAETTRLFTQSKSPTCRRGLGFDKPLAGNPKLSPCGALAPASVYGHTGFTGTCFWIDPDNKIIYIFLSNRVNPTRANNKLGSLDIRTRIQDAIYKSINHNL